MEPSSKIILTVTSFQEIRYQGFISLFNLRSAFPLDRLQVIRIVVPNNSCPGGRSVIANTDVDHGIGLVWNLNRTYQSVDGERCREAEDVVEIGPVGISSSYTVVSRFLMFYDSIGAVVSFRCSTQVVTSSLIIQLVKHQRCINVASTTGCHW